MTDKLDILLVDDEVAVQRALKRTLECLLSANIETASSGTEGLEICHKKTFDIVISDLSMPGMSGIEFLEKLMQIAPETIRIMLTAHGDAEHILEAINEAKVWSYLTKPWDDRRLQLVIGQAVKMRSALVERTMLKTALVKAESRRKRTIEGFIGESKALRNAYSIIEKAAPSNASVFITGESGVGKEVAAQAIHNLSKRKLDNFVALNCAAIPSELMESEIFGHVKGAFSGAVTNRDGAATQADNGTLFLDELGEMDMSLQAKILRFIQTGTFQRVGSGKLEKVNVRFIAATNREPLKAIADGHLREDLFYRLNVIALHLPPLRERGDDVLLLANHFLHCFMAEESKVFSGFSEDAKILLRKFSWPGNVRQLQNLIHSCVVMNEGPLLTASMLSSQLPTAQESIVPIVPQSADIALDDQAVSIHTDLSVPLQDEGDIRTLADIERKAIQDAIAFYEDNVVKAANALGVSPSTLYRKIQQW
ncbi:sigma-54 dependent transcriptional regulator [Alteromonas sp. D210916BOD_24]|uniref:sigma-54-dependent transcriptional regulator n=1 Tax=Alteromonas sp. D210916BOD_24 TaxID=3157618 RepID=UPI00399C59D2